MPDELLKVAIEQAKFQLVHVDNRFDAWLTSLLQDHLHGVNPARRDVLDAVLDVVKQRGVKMLLVEHEYVDADFLDTYARHYSRAFRLKPSCCKRLHFFGEALSEESIFDLSAQLMSKYLGFCILRPTGSQYVGRTVIVPPNGNSSDSYFIHAAAKFRTHIAGQLATVEGSPFIQQDASTFVCAGAAIWTVGLYMHQRYGYPRYYPGEIESFAQESYAHGQVRQGLTVPQIVFTLRKMGLNPRIEVFPRLDKTRQRDAYAAEQRLAIITDYLHVLVDSGIPPILCVFSKSGHAVAVVGHDVVYRDTISKAAFDAFRGTLRNSVAVDRFFVMDDARGPYVGFPVRQRLKNELDLALDQVADIVVIAPMPAGVTIDYNDAINDWSRLLFYWNSFLEKQQLRVKHGIRVDADDPVVLRPSLFDSREWKKAIIEQGNLPAWLRRSYQAMLMPKFIWVIELGYWKAFNKPGRSQRRIFGEVVLDATADPHWPFDSTISIHAHGLLLDVSRQNQARFVACDDSFVEYSPLRRAI